MASRILQYETNPHNARPLLQRARRRGGVYFNPPALPLETADMDALYDLPFNRAPHPTYARRAVPAFETVKHSIVTMRGCFGGCTFCSITEHEGRIIQSRSRRQRACARCARSRAWTTSAASITDLGGPTANMYKMRCKDESIETRVPAPLVRASRASARTS